MTRRKFLIALAALALVGAGVWAWRHFFPDEKARIVRRLEAAADAVCIDGSEGPTDAPAKLRRLESLLDDRVEVDVRIDRKEYRNTFARGDVLATLAAGRRAGVTLEVKLADVSVELAGDTARAEAGATISGRNGGREFSHQEDVAFVLVRRDGKWRISRVALRSFMER